MLNSSLDGEYATITNAICANSIKCYRWGRLLRITTAGTITSTLTAGTQVSIGTLPENFCPGYTVSKHIIYRSGTDYRAHGRLIIDGSTGVISLIPHEVPTSGGTLFIDETFF